MTTTITASLPRTPEEILAPGVVKQYLPVTNAERFARFTGDGELTAAVSLDIGWVYPEFSGEGQMSADTGGTIIPVNADLSGDGLLEADSIAVPKAFASFEGTGTPSATVSIVKRSFVDNFDRANGSIGANYFVPVSGQNQPVIVSGVAQAFSTSGTVVTPALYTYPMATDDMKAVMTTSAVTNTAQSELYVRTLNTGTLISTNVSRPNGGVVCFIWSTQLKLYTASDSATLTEQAAKTGMTIANGDVIELRAVGSTYTVFVNGAQQLSWSDPGGVVPVGADRRYCGFAPVANDGTHMTRFDAFACADL
ncbi:hypothetical protein QT969_10370 [Rhodococcus sp. CSLK01-03]|uniref:Uncharacterized protein n=1 Tax=Rhodococcus indonesiensis TaxID=3055869 RepID=A0ABT7RM25_9NOCA|nr:hypothetical protein [Rhodococcus indonesiensis]MDM7488695.1 hypothetical protein [Rhodococcus indonesiensis]